MTARQGVTAGSKARRQGACSTMAGCDGWAGRDGVRDGWAGRDGVRDGWAGQGAMVGSRARLQGRA